MSDLDILEAAQMMGFTEQYVRMLIRDGKLQNTYLAPKTKGSAVMKRFVPKKSIEDFFNTSTRKSKRSDGRNKYVFYANPSEFEMAMKAWQEYNEYTATLVPLVRTANVLKPLIRKDNNHG